MAHVTVEYMIMVPVLILQIFLFPIVAGAIMDNWNTTQTTLELQESAGHLGSTIQQVYYTITRIGEDCTMKINLDLAQHEQYAYTVTLTHAEGVDTAYSIMNVSMQVVGGKGFGSSVVTLGSDVDWEDGLSFSSIQQDLSLVATKTGGSITLTVEAD